MLLRNFKKLNYISALSVAFITLIVYILTVSRTVNFWDCGELIASAYKLQVPHPPGAPFYIIIARFFSIFAGNVENVALAVNFVSVISASVTIFFLFLCISHFSLLILKKDSSELTITEKIITLAASAIGSFSLAFSMSFWESATEAEVYALSTCFFAITLYTTLRWSVTKSDRLLLLIALLIGISSGIHFLNLLVIPALVIIYYFGKYRYSHLGFFKAVVASLLLLYLILSSITFIPLIAAQFELLFVNDFGLSFNSGLYIFSILILLIIILTIIYSHRKKKPLLNLITICVFLFLSGYSVYTTVIIRANANPPINENNPDNIFSFISYISREQYQSPPLTYGQHFNSKLDKREPYKPGKSQYRRIEDRYELVNKTPKENFRKSEKMLFPRMWSREPAHILAYREWSNVGEGMSPNQGQNIRFLTRYQLGHMYFRYLLQNFSGIQNDLQGHGGHVRGNWLSGIPLVDNFRLGINSDSLPLRNSSGKRYFYFIPFIFALVGIFIQLKTDRKNLFVVFLLFIFSGIAIILYLNQHPYQARERDYSYLASFFTFSIWIGLGLVGLYKLLERYLRNKYSIIALATLAMALAPIQLLTKNYRYLNRSSDNFTLNFAYNYLMSCEKDAILFTSGDNETFPLWYLQEVRGVRTDIKIVNLAFLNFDWYIDQVKQKSYDSDGLPIAISRNKYFPGERDFLVYKENIYAFVEEIFLSNHREITEDYHNILNTFLTMLTHSGFSEQYPDEFISIGYHYKNIQPHGADEGFRHFGKIINDLQEERYRDELMISQEQADELRVLFERFLAKQLLYHVPLEAVLRFIFSDDESTRVQSRIYQDPIDYLPVRRLRIDVDRDNFFESNNLPDNLENNFTEKMQWKINSDNITKSDVFALEIIRSNNWNRPVYFSSTMVNDNYLGLDNYLFLEGWAYRLLPVEYNISDAVPTNINAYQMYENVVSEFELSHYCIDRYYNENARSLMSRKRFMLSRLAEALYFVGEIEKSRFILDKSAELIPNSILPYDYFVLDIIKGYYRLGRPSLALEHGEILIENSIKNLERCFIIAKRDRRAVKSFIQRDLSTLRDLNELASEYNHTQMQIAVNPVFDKYFKMFMSIYK